MIYDQSSMYNLVNSGSKDCIKLNCGEYVYFLQAEGEFLYIQLGKILRYARLGQILADQKFIAEMLTVID